MSNQEEQGNVQYQISKTISNKIAKQDSIRESISLLGHLLTLTTETQPYTGADPIAQSVWEEHEASAIKRNIFELIKRIG